MLGPAQTQTAAKTSTETLLPEPSLGVQLQAPDTDRLVRRKVLPGLMFGRWQCHDASGPERQRSRLPE